MNVLAEGNSIDGEKSRELVSTGAVAARDMFSSHDVHLLSQCARSLFQEDKAGWLEQVANANASALFLDVYSPEERSEAISRAVGRLRKSEVVTGFLGKTPRVTAIQLRITPPNPVSYIPWHVDVELFSEPRLKAMVYLSDVLRDGGAFAFVPGSHGPNSPAILAPKKKSDMKNQLIFAGPPGTVLFFDPKGWHTMLANRSSHARYALIVEFSNDA